MSLGLNILLLFIASILAVLNYFNIDQEQFDKIKRNTPVKYYAIKWTIPLIMVLLFFSICKSKVDDIENETREKLSQGIDKKMDFQIKEIQSQQEKIRDFKIAIDTLTKARDRESDKVQVLIEEVKKYKPTYVFQQKPQPFGRPVFELCKDNRINLEPFPGGLGNYKLKVNFCTDRSVHDIKVTPYFIVKNSERTVYITRTTKSAWDIPPMSKERAQSYGGMLPILDIVPDTMFMFFQGTLKNDDEVNYPIDMVYYSVWSTGLWYGAPTDMKYRIKALVRDELITNHINNIFP